MKRKWILALCLVAAIATARNYLVQGKVTLNATVFPASPLYIIHNISDEPLWLVHENTTGTAQAGWSSQIDPGRWTVLLMQQHNFTLSCHLVEPANPANVVVPCEKHIQITIHDDYKVPEEAKNQSYWVVENVASDDVESDMKARGFEPIKE